jgi:UDP:flavonoid glycosyltransferase YjiC (YdhE family)
MSSIIVASIPVHGHVTPMLIVAENLVKRGDDVRFVTGSRYAAKVAATGATFVPLPPEADYDDQNFLESFPERAGLKGIKAVSFDIENVFIRPAKLQYQTLIAALATAPADIVLAEQNFIGATFMLGHPRSTRPAVVMCSVIPLPLDSRDTAPFGMGLRPARVFNRQRNALLAAMSRRVMGRPNRLVDDMHRELHGTGMPGAPIDWGRRADGIVQFSVASFEYPRSDAPTNLHYIGPISATSSPAPLPDWWGDLDGSRPVIHVTQGTAANTDFSQAIAPTLDALADEDLLVVVATGGRPLDMLPTLPANARAATYLPYDELLPRTSVYVTNAGYGGVQRRVALRGADRRHRRQGRQARSRRPHRVDRRRAADQK